MTYHIQEEELMYRAYWGKRRFISLNEKSGSDIPPYLVYCGHEFIYQFKHGKHDV